MAEYKKTDIDGNLEKNKTVYLGKTKKRCTTCGKANMAIKTRVEGTTTLECPNCDQTENIPTAAEKHI
jgi:predicted RNA-binding Zn-ribbon protein involved in translation (DUF1610 family)